MIRKVLILLMLGTTALATDLTPYNFALLRCSPDAHPDSSVTWVVERYDMASHFGSGAMGSVYFDSLLDTASVLGKSFWAGPYGSDQQLGMIIYDNPDYNTQYAERIGNSTAVWLPLFLEHYLDSIGSDPDTCCIHWADTGWSLINDGRSDGRRRTVLDTVGLNYKETRFSYQTFDNDTNDTAYYPAGYYWLANGQNTDVQKGIAYAFRRRFFETNDRTNIDGGAYHQWNYVYMDNQYRDMGLMGSYWTLDSAKGGPTTGIDFMEGGWTNFDEDNIANNNTYFDESTIPIDSVLMAVLDSIADADGYDRVETYANVDWDDPSDVYAVAPYVSGIFFETPLQPNRTAYHYDRQDRIHDSMTTVYNNTRAVLYQPSANFATTYFNNDTSRALRATYAFFMAVQDTNYIYMPDDICDMDLLWKSIYLVDFGSPVLDTPYNAYSGGTGWYTATPYNWVKRRDYGADTSAIVLFRTSAGSDYDFITDSVEVNVADGQQNVYYTVGIDGDTSLTSDSIFYLKPFDGLFLVATASSSINSTTVKSGTIKAGIIK